MGRLTKLLRLHQHDWQLIDRYMFKRPNRAAFRSATAAQRGMMPSSEAFMDDVEARIFKCRVCGKERRRDQRVGA